MGLFNTVVKSVAKKAALAALVVVGKRVLTKAIGSAIDKRKEEDAVASGEAHAPAQTSPAQTSPVASDTPVKAKPVRKSRAKAKPAVDAADKPAKKPTASRSKPKAASSPDASPSPSTSAAPARKPRAPRKAKAAAEPQTANEAANPVKPAVSPVSV